MNYDAWKLQSPEEGPDYLEDQDLIDAFIEANYERFEQDMCERGISHDYYMDLRAMTQDHLRVAAALRAAEVVTVIGKGGRS